MSTQSQQGKWVDIAIGVLKRDQQVCISLRQKHQHLGGHWEFPGGKIESGETVEQALQREFLEELGVRTHQWQPLISVPWDYGEIAVRLHVYVSECFDGEPEGKEGQLVEWCEICDLTDKRFPEANAGILMALALPKVFMSIGNFDSLEDGLRRLRLALENGVRLAQLKLAKIAPSDRDAVVEAFRALSTEYQAILLLNASPEVLQKYEGLDGIQLSASQAEQYSARPIDLNHLLAVSTHDLSGMRHALAIGADLILLSPIQFTKAHPDLQAIGWSRLNEWLKEIPVPVYALGGMGLEDMQKATASGAQGVMLTRGVWPD
ncbi:Nudix family hydrolase [Thiomicrorhabdus chilensis]|uniref:Nudix family hydrolase n=1 Tax=Thiomicrorhabdus chilensis TaxID=63656 RepID=UPI0003F7A226|nr:Nudix family hydrolase [Thiomicrorhabdus chilensis]